MRRLLWLGIGLAVGALVVRAVTKKAQAFTPQGIAAQARDSAAGFAGTVRGFVDDVRDGMAEREAEIHAAFTDGSTLDEDLYPEGRQHR
ncbi:hypothetical protein AB0K00_06775 [Dactylosporangium sp. NPDC049525]|uniref:hypothetical protein n=1 Tax=Dactylosporangium sp. NPDC049525 TaxID=3154730 RepID=UPI00344372DF